jgi:hypothetical protein
MYVPCLEIPVQATMKIDATVVDFFFKQDPQKISSDVKLASKSSWGSMQ